MAAAHLKWQQDYDWDLVKVSPASSYSALDWGVRDRWMGHIEGTRETTHYAIQKPEDWSALQPLDPHKGALGQQLDALRQIGRGLNAETPFIATVFSPLAQAKHLVSKEKLLTHLREYPEEFYRGLEVITKTTMRFIEAAKESGISGIFYAVQHARYPLLSRDEFITFGRVYDLRVLEAAQDLWCNMLHIHSTDVMFDLVANYPVQFVNWHDRETTVDLKNGLTRIRKAASGGISQWTMHQEDPQNLLAEAHDAVAQTNGRRLMLGTGCVIMVTTPTRNIRALREFVEE
jgi:uroporphyrinogen decarboxylase